MATKNRYYKGDGFKAGILDDGDVDANGISPALWNYRKPHQFPTPEDETLYDYFISKIDRSPEKVAAKFRKVISRDMVATDPSKPDRKFEKLTLSSEYTCYTRKEYKVRVQNLAKGLKEIYDFKALDRVVIYAETQADWLVSAFACWCLNLTVVTVYATLGAEGASYGIKQTHAPVVIVDAKLGKNMSKILASCPEVKKVVTIGEVDIDGCESVTFDSVLALGQAVTGEFKAEKGNASDCAVIMYTSGTTGNPKGVCESHRNIICQALGGEVWFRELEKSNDDLYLAYLPLAHIMELIAELFLVGMGITLAYGNPHTLTASGVKLAKGSIGDLECARPTIMAFAPAVLDKIYAAVNLKMSTGIKKTILDWATESGHKNQESNNIGAHWIYGPILTKIQELVGGRIRIALSGSAPLAPTIQRFMQTVLNVPIRQGYGLTETCAISCLAELGSNAVNNVGPPTPSTVIRLRDWKEGGYCFDDRKDEKIGKPRGEILIGGPAVCMGYLEDDADPEQAKMMQAKNAEEFLEIEGVRYFCTGDIGQINHDGQLQIVDRKKDLFKGGNGEYVALTKVEAALKLSKYCDIPMVYGKTGENSVVCVFCPSLVQLDTLGNELGIKGTHAEIAANADVKKTIIADMNLMCKNSKLHRFEMPTGFEMVFNEQEPAESAWTPVNGMLTDTFKLKRPLIYKAHKELIDAMY